MTFFLTLISFICVMVLGVWLKWCLTYGFCFGNKKNAQMQLLCNIWHDNNCIKINKVIIHEVFVILNLILKMLITTSIPG